MKSRHRRAAALIAVLVSSLFLAGCRSRSAVKGSATTGSPDGVGIAECDDYLAKYSRCVDGKVPADQRKVFEESLARMRAAWKTMAADPGARPGLGQSCSLALETARSSLQQYGCAW
jgi:hypothetical protein